MDNIKSFAHQMRNELPVEYDSLPDIELYMDQVLAFLSRKRVSGRDGDSLTSAMINNYIKDGLVPRAVGKKYSREHLVYLSLVARLKQVLSVKDMTILLKHDMADGQHEEYYANLRNLLDNAFSEIEQTASADESQSISSLALELAITSYVNKVVSEYLIDQLSEQIEKKEAPSKKSKAELKDSPKEALK
ncbi:MAG: DUF1836 domain-containing protein [Oscillospiraceae bacterium]